MLPRHVQSAPLRQLPLPLLVPAAVPCLPPDLATFQPAQVVGEFVTNCPSASPSDHLTSPPGGAA